MINLEQEDFVNFDDFEEEQTINSSILCNADVKKPYMKNNKIIIYDRRTEEYYDLLRKLKIDPITREELTDSNAFTYENEWDPYTGEILGIDPRGKLYFDPHYLVRYFYIKRYSKLWVDKTVDATGTYQGYYDEGVGSGKNFYIHTVGTFPEYYLFRLPITDCYLTDDHKDIFITMGPILTDTDIFQIHNLAEKNPDRYKKLFGHNLPSLVKMKKYYELAISTNPLDLLNSMNKHKISDDEKVEYNCKINRKYVDKLVNM